MTTSMVRVCEPPWCRSGACTGGASGARTGFTVGAGRTGAGAEGAGREWLLRAVAGDPENLQ
ncbi:hypothetical protein, partial [Kitasatospora sp. NPDC093806]|uniref:hypothetical protein n=1 Tax=Kitasatospora sp. NPDC093806 TaxID=3155075 RepID=UPI0034258B76